MNKFKWVATLSHVELNSAELDYCQTELAEIVDKPEEQSELFDYCRKWKMAPWIYLQLIKYDLIELFNDDVHNRFKEFYNKVKIENESRNEVAVNFLKEFHDKGIEVIILKGNLFTRSVYHDVGYKKMNDFDILVHKEDWDRIQDIYFGFGYIPLGFGWGGEKQKPTKFSHTGIPFISSDFKCIIGTQWGLKSPTTKFKLNSKEIWDESLPFEFNGVDCRQLSPEYNLLHLILHLGIYKCGIRDCMDLYNLVSVTGIDWLKMKKLIIETNAVDKAVFAFEMCNICSDRIPKHWVEELKLSKGFLSRRIKNRKRMFNETGDIQNSYNDYFQDIEKNVLYFNISPKFHHRAYFYGKIVRLIFFPDKEHKLKFIDYSTNPKFKHLVKGTLLGPYFAFSMISQEIGGKVTGLLFTKLFFDVLISPINYVIPRQSYFDYLKSKGIDPEEIKKMVRNVQ